MNIFDENNCGANRNMTYTPEAKELQKDINIALQPIYDKWVEKGMSIDKIGYLIDHIKMDISLNYMLGL